MTSSKPSDGSSKSPNPATSEEGVTARSASLGEEVCTACGGPMRLRNARPFPVALQAAFGISFVIFLWAQGAGKVPTKFLWGWSAFQIVLGILLIRARFASAKKVFICLRCGATLR